MSGQITTSGDRILKSDNARAAFQVNGAGIKIGIISTSFDTQGQLNNDIANGELPGFSGSSSQPVEILKDLAPGNLVADDEGRALAQIIYDIAPGAELLFHTSIGEFNTIDDTSYATAIAALTKAGANIIVEDAIIPTSIFQNGAAAQAAQNAVGQGVVVITAAGNNGNIAYQSAYRSDGTTFEFGGKTFEALDFDASANTDFFQDITATKDQTAVLPLLTWSEPNGQVTSNFEMFLLNSPSLPTNLGDNILTISGPPSQTAIDYPLKELIYPTAKDQKAYLVIGRELNGAAAPEQIKWISNANGLDRTTKYEYINSTAAETGSSSIFGVANLPEVITVGAADQNQDFSSDLATVRDYSSRNSSEIIFDDSGDLIFGGEPRTKPDIIAPDGVSTSVAGFENFQGTSAAAPHIAGIVALMKQAAGGADALSPSQVLEILQDTATPLNPPQASGRPLFEVGLAQADAAIARSQIVAENPHDFMCSAWR
jgi:hypothetical protein